MPFDPEPGGSPQYIGLVAAREIASGEAEVIQGIQEVGLADAIIAADADDPFIEAEGGLRIVLEADKRYLFYPEQKVKLAVKYYLS